MVSHRLRPAARCRRYNRPTPRAVGEAGRPAAEGATARNRSGSHTTDREQHSGETGRLRGQRRRRRGTKPRPRPRALPNSQAKGQRGTPPRDRVAPSCPCPDRRHVPARLLPAPAQPARTRAPRRLRWSPHRPQRRRDRHHAGRGRPRFARRADRSHHPGQHQGHRRIGPARQPDRSRGAGQDPRHRRQERRLPQFHRPGLPRHPHAQRHPAQHPGEPGLVHRLHALPGGDFPGPDGGADQFPADVRRPHRHGHRQRLAAGRGQRRGRGHDPGQALVQVQIQPVLRRRRRASADPGSGAHACGRPGHRPAGRPGDRCGRRRQLRRAAAIPQHLRRHRRPRRPGRCGACAPGHRRRGHRPARADPDQGAGRMGRGHRGRQQPALRRAVRLWRPARGVHGLPRRLQALHARSPDRGVDRFRRQSRLPPDPADPRAAHPPREGHLQHLHRTGAAGGDGGHVCGLPRARGPGSDRAPRAPDDRDPRRRAAPGRGAGVGRLLRHPAGHRRGRRPGAPVRQPPAHQPAQDRRDPRRHQPGRDHHPRRPGRAGQGLRRRAGRQHARRARRGHRRRPAGGPAARNRVPAAPGVQHPPQ